MRSPNPEGLSPSTKIRDTDRSISQDPGPEDHYNQSSGDVLVGRVSWSGTFSLWTSLRWISRFGKPVSDRPGTQDPCHGVEMESRGSAFWEFVPKGASCFLLE